MTYERGDAKNGQHKAKRMGIVFELAVLLLLTCCPLVRVLSVREEGRGKPSAVLVSLEAARDGFVISYTHSVNKGRVRDFYACEGSRLLLEKTVFVSYGAGMPEEDDAPGASFSVTDSGYEMSGMGRATDSLRLAVGLVARHSLAVRQGGAVGEELYLEEIFGVQSPLLLRVSRVSLLRYLLAWKLNAVQHHGNQFLPASFRSGCRH